MLKVTNDNGELVFEFNDIGYYGMIANTLLMDMACGNYNKTESRVICYLLTTCVWNNTIDIDKTKGSKMVGISYRSYLDTINSLIEKRIIFEDEGVYYFNPEMFRRKPMYKLKKNFKKFTPNIHFEDEENGGEEGEEDNK